MERKKRGHSIHSKTSKSSDRENKRSIPSGPLPVKRPAKRLDKETKTANQLIEERTKELLKANEALQAEINKRKRAEEELNICKMHLKDTMDMGRIAYWEADEESQEFIFNDAIYNLYGTTVDIEGGYRLKADDYFKRFIHPDDLPEVLRMRKLRNESIQSPISENSTLEYRAIRRDGEIRHFIVGARGIRDASGKIIKTFGIKQDITDLRKMEQTLRESQEKLQKIFDSSADGISLLDLQGNILDCNQSLVRMHGYTSRDEIIGKNFLTFVHPDDQQTTMDAYQDRVGGENSPDSKKFRVMQKNGSFIFIEARASIIRDVGEKPQYIVSIVRDMTEHKKMEDEQLQRARDFEALNEMGIFINQSLADLNTLLSTALEKAMNLAGFELGAIFLLNEEKDLLNLKYHIGWPLAIAEKGVIAYDQGVSGKAIALKQPVFSSIDEYPTPEMLPPLIEEGIQSIAAFPLLVRGEATGTITLMTRSPRKFGRREMALLENIGNQIGLAVENARLFSAVSKAKKEWETTFDAVTDTLMIVDKDYRIVRTNKAHERIGLKVNALIGRKCFEVLEQGDKICEGCPVSGTLRTKEPVVAERINNISQRELRLSSFPIFDKAGEIITVVELAQDITEEKRREREKEVVNDINRILASSIDIRQGIHSVYTEMKKILDAEGISIALFDEEGEVLWYFALEKDYEAEELVKDVAYPREGSHFETVAETGLPLIIPDIRETDSWGVPKLLKEGILSALLFPLEYNGKIIGTINFGSSKPNQFSEAQFGLLQQIAPSLAIAVQSTLFFEEMKESEERYRTVVQSALEGICVLGGNNRIRYANEKMAEIHGCRLEELIGTDFRDYLDEESRRLLADREDQRKRGIRLSPHFELNLLHRNGEVRNEEANARAIKDSKGDVNIIVFLKDITKRKQAEEELRISQMQLAEAMDIARIAYWELDIQTQQFIFNDAFYALYGTTAEAEGGYRMKSEEYFKRFMRPDDFAKLSQTIEKGLQSTAHKYISQTEHRIIRRDGVIRYILNRSSLFKDDRGNLTKVYGTNQDITERKQAEQALRESEERFRLLVEHSADAFFLHDFDGKIVDVNQNACDSLEYTREELLALTMADIDQDIIPGRHQELWKHMVSEIPVTVEGIHRRKDGSIFPVEVHIQLFESNTRKLILGLVRDITMRKQSEKTLRENQEELIKKNKEIEENRSNLQLALEELEQAYKELKKTQSKILQQEKMASIGQIAAGVAHEINNPLAFISSNLGTLSKYFSRFTEYIQDQRKVIESLPATEKIEELKQKEEALKLDYILEDTKGVITESIDGTERVQKIVQGLKSFARIDEAEYKYANINDCIESTLNIVRNELQYKATLRKEYGNIPITKCYPQQMNQVFMNLLINAVQAIDKQGEITIRTWHEGKTIFIAISDTGQGIPKENLEKIYEPFFTTKEVGKGTGLGLSIAYEIIQKHNGEITVESEIGKGTTFTIKIPIL